MNTEADHKATKQVKRYLCKCLVMLILFVICLLLYSFWPAKHAARPIQSYTPNPKAMKSLTEFKQHIAYRARHAGASEKIINTYLLPSKLDLSSKRMRASIEHHVPIHGLSFASYWPAAQKNCPAAQLQAHYKRYAKPLKNIQHRYGVPAGYLVALWCTESSFGKHVGRQALIPSLLTLAYLQTHRRNYFTQQLIDALVILSRLPTINTAELHSTFDGGMGQTQFEPSSYLLFAQHYTPAKASASHQQLSDTSNVWGSAVDALASAANFLKQQGWQAKQPCWGFPVQLDPSVDWQLFIRKKQQFTLRLWQELGVATNKRPQSCARQPLRLLLTGSHKKSGFLVYPNFNVLLHWNPRLSEALSVGLLHDQLESTSSNIAQRA